MQQSILTLDIRKNKMRKNMMRYMDKIYENLLYGFIALIVKFVWPFLFPIGGFLIFTGCVVICDTITGIIAAKKRGEIITSYGLRRTTEKMILYFIAIMLAEGIRITFIENVDVAYFVAFVIAVTEFKSNIENIESITHIKLWEAISERLLPKKK